VSVSVDLTSTGPSREQHVKLIAVWQSGVQSEEFLLENSVKFMLKHENSKVNLYCNFFSQFFFFKTMFFSRAWHGS